MRYMLLIYSKEQEASAERMEACGREHASLMDESSRRGVLISASPLEPVGTATTVRRSGAHPIVTDGPFAETKEQLAGYYLLDCRDLDEAIEWAARLPTDCFGGEGCVEIRPLRNVSSERSAGLPAAFLANG